MKRKVIQLAGKTFVVSLPQKWASAYKIKKGDELEVEEADHKLIVSPEKDNAGSFSFNVSGCQPMIKRILGALYKTGYDEAEIIFSTQEELFAILSVVKDEFVGFEVIKRSASSITIKNVATVQYGEFDTMLRRIFLILLQMAEEGLEALKNKRNAQISAIVHMDLDINRYADFCRRILNKKGYSKFGKTQLIYYIVEELEKTADCLRDLCSYGLESKTEPSSEVIVIFAEVNRLIRQFYTLYYEFSLVGITSFGKKHNELIKIIRNTIGKNKKDSRYLLHLHDAAQNCFAMNGALIAINF